MSSQLTILTIPHPDDEIMFFLPTILNSKNVHIICTTNGDYDGLGDVREAEFYDCITRLNEMHVYPVTGELLKIPGILDGPNKWLKTSLLSSSLKKIYLRLHKSDGYVVRLLTFDSRGVSGHINHIQTYEIVKSISEELNLELVTLKTLPIYYNFFPFSLIYFIWLLLIAQPKLILTGPFKTHEIMNKCYKSQWVWYRVLWCFFGSYCWFNVLEGEEVRTDAKSGGFIIFAF